VRILFLAHRLPYPPNKGDKIRSFRELEGLARAHDVDLFCFYDLREDAEYFSQVRKYCRDFYAERISWLRSRAQASAAFVLGRPFTMAFYASPIMTRRIRKALAERKYDLAFVFSSSMAPYTDGAPQPRILDMVDVDSDKWNQYATYTRPPLSWIWRAEGRRLAKYEERCVRQFSITLLSTRSEVDILRAHLPVTTIEHLENEIDADYFNPGRVEVPPEIAAWQPYIVFTGSMDYFPNIDAVTFFYREVFTRIRSALPHARFVIAGRNPASAVRRLARDAAVWVTGAVPDIRPYLRGASAAVGPLRIARGVQNKIFEAMAMGLVVSVSSKAAKSLPESVRSALHVEDDPLRLAIFLIEKLRGTRSASEQTSRDCLLQYCRDLGWQSQLEGILQRALTARNKFEAHLPVPAHEYRCSTVSPIEDRESVGKTGDRVESSADF
jgi:polysaccharide biosynthesis protein PslH